MLLRNLLHRTSRAVVLCCSIILLAGTAQSATIVQVTTTVGDFEIELMEQAAPETVANFLQYVEERFYDGLIFHRVKPGFVVQAGGFDAQLNRREAERLVVNESVGGVRNIRGSVAMARHSDPDSASSQFYVNLNNNRSLDAMRRRPGYTVFGHVIRGWSTIDAIAAGRTGPRNGMYDVPLEPVVIEHIRVKEAVQSESENSVSAEANADDASAL